MSGSDLRTRYANEIRKVVNARWNNSSVPARVRCSVKFTQIPGGTVIRTEFLDCPYSDAAKETVAHALVAGSLPYAGFEAVFSPEAVITFCAPIAECDVPLPKSK